MTSQMLQVHVRYVLCRAIVIIVMGTTKSIFERVCNAHYRFEVTVMAIVGPEYD